MSMNPAFSDDFREQLSAWHDGALPDEASRFVLKRLLADEGLRAEVGRWQAVGDALRRQSQQRPVTDLPARIALAIEADSDLAASSVPARAAEPRAGRAPAIRWMATAAAFGLAAVLVWPGSAPPAPEGPSVARVAPSPAEATTPSRAMPATDREALAAIATPLRRDPRAPLIAAPASEAADSLIARVPPLVRAPQPTPEQLAPLPAVEALPSVDAPSRPWPRSAQGEAAYTVDYAVPAAAPTSR